MATVGSLESPAYMKGIQITEFKRPYKFSKEIPVPYIERDNEIIIKVAVAGYCHGDIMIQYSDLEHLPFGVELPLIPSHEGAGIVVALGQGVKDLQIGDRVGTLAYKNPCGNCEDCNDGIETFCEKLQLCGVTVNGAAAEYMVADANATIKIPDNIPFEAAAPLMCAGSTIYAGLKKAGLKPGETVAIIGIGALGHLGVQLAKCMGLLVVAVDSRQAPLDLVKKLKHAPEFVINSSAMNVNEAIKAIGGKGVHASVIAAGANAAFDFGLKFTRKHGTVVAIGLPPEPIQVHYSDWIFRNLNLKSAQLGSPELTREMVDIVAKHGIEVKTRVYALENFETLLADYHQPDRAGKFVMRINDEI